MKRKLIKIKSFRYLVNKVEKVSYYVLPITIFLYIFSMEIILIINYDSIDNTFNVVLYCVQKFESRLKCDIFWREVQKLYLISLKIIIGLSRISIEKIFHYNYKQFLINNISPWLPTYYVNKIILQTALEFALSSHRNAHDTWFLLV